MENQSEIAVLLLKLEMKLFNPDTRSSAKDMSELLADEFIEIGSSGRVFNKQMVLKGLQNEKLFKYSISEFRIKTLADDLVLATYLAINKDESERPHFSLRSSIWRKTEDKWQIVFHQDTPTTLETLTNTQIKEE